MSTEVYFSCDIEADGPIPGPYSMSSFGLVVCGARDRGGEFRRIGVEAYTFYQELAPISDNFIPEAAAVSGLDRDMLIKTGESPTFAMQYTAKWVTAITNAFAENASPVFVAYPLSFDWLFFYWYMMKFNDSSPFGHSTALDIKTLYATKTNTLIRDTGKRAMPKHLHSNRKHTHNALDDAKEQGELFQNIMMWDGK